MSSPALKFDEDKPPLHLLPKAALIEIARVLAFGAKKYQKEWNWANGFDWSRLISAAERHLFAFEQGEDLDKDSGFLHLSNLGCCVLFLIIHQLYGLGKDDRYIFPKRVYPELKGNDPLKTPTQPNPDSVIELMKPGNLDKLPWYVVQYNCGDRKKHIRDDSRRTSSIRKVASTNSRKSSLRSKKAKARRANSRKAR